MVKGQDCYHRITSTLNDEMFLARMRPPDDLPGMVLHFGGSDGGDFTRLHGYC
jgi:hypothetical protein